MMAVNLFELEEILDKAKGIQEDDINVKAKKISVYFDTRAKEKGEVLKLKK